MATIFWTDHAGRLPRPDELIDLNRARIGGQPYDAAAFPARLHAAVASIPR